MNEELVTCCNCDCEIELEDSNTIDNECYCEDCTSELFISCEFCGEYTPNDETISYTSDRNYTEYCCSDCADRRLTKCDDCGEYFESIHTDSNNTSYCDSCSENFYICSDCGEWVNSDYMCYSEETGETYCESCYSNHNHGGSEHIHDYSFKPSPIFHGHSLVQYGLELETDKGNNMSDYAEELHDLSNDEDIFYLKEDGSLNEGVEIVTHPCSLDYHLNNFPWSDILQTAKNNDFQSHDADTCGLHIHVSRKAFGLDYDEQEKNIAKLLFLVNNNWNDMVKFSRRTESQLSRWAKRYSEKNTAIELLEEGKQAGRYMAVNLQNSNTVEFRLFRGTLKLETLYATIELVDLLVKSSVNISINELYTSHLSTLIENSTSYTYLKDYCIIREIIESKEGVAV